MDIQENSYGFLKRFRYFSNHIRICAPKIVLDYGCGTGLDVTFPLAKAFPGINFIGVDKDVGSIKFAHENNNLPNLHFFDNNQLPADLTFDLVICSEVIEHLEYPSKVLMDLHNKLNFDGTLILTLPNGYGPFELTCFIQNLLLISRIIPILRFIKRKFIPNANLKTQKNSLAISPHINFFAFNQITKIITNAGFRILEYRPRTFLCGLGFDQLIFTDRLREYNQRIADILPYWMNSGWMFISEKSIPLETKFQFRRNFITRFRKSLSIKASNL